jgi:hypothetical protein
VPYVSLKSPRKAADKLILSEEMQKITMRFEEPPVLERQEKGDAATPVTPVMPLAGILKSPRDPSVSPRDRGAAKASPAAGKGGASPDYKRSGSSCSDYSKDGDGMKKAKIGITIKKSPNSDRTFESRLLDSEFEDAPPPAPLKNKMLDLNKMDSESDSVASEDDVGKKEEMKRSIFMKRKSDESGPSLSPRALSPAKAAHSPGGRSGTFSFSSTKKATNEIIKNEILKNEILKRKSEELSSQPRVPKVKAPVAKGSAGESTGPSDSSEEDGEEEESEYEIEEIYQLQEWCVAPLWSCLA